MSSDILFLTRIVVIMQIIFVTIFWEGSDCMPLYNHLKEYRAKLGVNQQEMGQLVGVSRQTISQIERGDYSPSVTVALRIAKACHATVEDIFQYEEEG